MPRNPSRPLSRAGSPAFSIGASAAITPHSELFVVLPAGCQLAAPPLCDLSQRQRSKSFGHNLVAQVPRLTDGWLVVVHLETNNAARLEDARDFACSRAEV